MLEFTLALEFTFSSQLFFYCAKVCLKIISAACITRNFQFRKFLSVNSNLCYTVVTVF